MFCIYYSLLKEFWISFFGIYTGILLTTLIDDTSYVLLKLSIMITPLITAARLSEEYKLFEGWPIRKHPRATLYKFVSQS